MKFNERLIELRKKEGLSQEELGYKLNVTRQTVSKWELGQTTPEMDKLVEISKIFNISVDELVKETEEKVNEEQVIEDQPIKETKEGKNNKKLLVILIGVLIVAFIFIMIKIVTPLITFNKVLDSNSKTEQTIIEYILSIFDIIKEQAVENQNTSSEIFNQIKDTQDKITGDMFNETDNFNKSLEMLSGRQMGRITLEILDIVSTNNKKEDKKISVKYMDIDTKNIDEIKNIRSKIKDFNDYDISYDYDKDGFINRVTIDNVVEEEKISDIDIRMFNNSIEIYSGTKMGGAVTGVLDNIITSNKKEERKITVKYSNIESQNEEEIKSIKRKIETFKNYEVSFDYDEDGFINKATIENI